VADSLTITVDTTALFAALDALGESARAAVKGAAKITADAIAREAGARIPRATGKTAEGITVEETHNGDGYVVYVKSPRMPNLPLWLEFGTKYMTARPYLFSSARLEEGPHLMRVADALQAAINAKGLGD